MDFLDERVSARLLSEGDEDLGGGGQPQPSKSQMPRAVQFLHSGFLFLS